MVKLKFAIENLACPLSSGGSWTTGWQYPPGRLAPRDCSCRGRQL